MREALLALEAEGYVRGLPHKGLEVPAIVPEHLGEICELRIMLERDLTVAALANMNAAGLEKLLSLQQELEAALDTGDLFKVRTANYRFHFCLYEMAERPQTLHFVRVLWAKYPFTLQDVRQDRPKRMRSEHNLFLERVQAHDHPGAAKAMVQHIKNGWREIPAGREPEPLRQRRRSPFCPDGAAPKGCGYFLYDAFLPSKKQRSHIRSYTRPKQRIE